MYKAPRAFKRFGIPIGLGPADRPQKPTRHHIHTDTVGGVQTFKSSYFGRLSTPPPFFLLFSFFCAPLLTLSLSACIFMCVFIPSLFRPFSLKRRIPLSYTRAFLPVTLGSGQGAIVTGLEGSSIPKVAIPKGYVNSFFFSYDFFFFIPVIFYMYPQAPLFTTTPIPPLCAWLPILYYYDYCFRGKDYTFRISPSFYKTTMTVFHPARREQNQQIPFVRWTKYYNTIDNIIIEYSTTIPTFV